MAESEVHVARRLADNVHRRALAVGNFAEPLHVFLVHDQAHALLALVAHNLAVREGLVAHGQGVHVDVAARLLHKLREAVEVPAGAVVVDGDDGVGVALDQGAYGVQDALLHLRVGALDGVELNLVAIFAGVDARDGAAAHADAVVVAAEQDHVLAFRGGLLEGVAPLGEAHAAGHHDDLVVGQRAPALLVLVGQERAAYHGLPELVAEVAGAVRGLDEDLGGGLVEPLAGADATLPGAVVGKAGVGGHVDRRPGHGQRARAAAHAVANLAAAARGGAVERLDGRREVVGLGLEREDGLYLLCLELRRGVAALGGELRRHGALDERHVVLVGRDQVAGVRLGGLADELEERELLLLAVDDERAVENLVAAVLGVDLREAEHLRVRQRPAQAGAQALQVGNLGVGEGQALPLVVCLEVRDVDNGVGGLVDGEDVLPQAAVEVLEHGVVLRVGAAHGEELLNAGDAADAHVLGNLDGVGAPRGDGLPPSPDEEAGQRLRRHVFRPAKKPCQFADVDVCQRLGRLDGQYVVSSEKNYHRICVRTTPHRPKSA